MKKNYLAPILSALIFISLFFLTMSLNTADAQVQREGGGTGGVQREEVNLNASNPFAFNTFDGLINLILDIVIKVGTILALFFLIYAGFKYVTAGGDEKKIGDANKMFLGVVIGTAIVLGSKAIAALLQGTVTGIIK